MWSISNTIEFVSRRQIIEVYILLIVGGYCDESRQQTLIFKGNGCT